MRIDVEKFKEWLKEQADYARDDMRRYAIKEQYEDAVASREELTLYTYLIDCIERPDYNEANWVIEDD